MILRNLLRLATQGGYKISHELVREKFGLQNEDYKPTPSVPTLLMYDALGICYSSDRDEMKRGFTGPDGQWLPGGSIASRCDMAANPKKYPSIQSREGIMYLDKETSSYLGDTGPQVIYNYYQGEFGGPKLAIMITDGASIKRNFDLSKNRYEVIAPVRFAMVAKQDLDDPMSGHLKISDIRVNGIVIKLDDANVHKAIAYAQALHDQIKIGESYDPDYAFNSTYGIAINQNLDLHKVL